MVFETFMNFIECFKIVNFTNKHSVNSTEFSNLDVYMVLLFEYSICMCDVCICIQYIRYTTVPRDTLVTFLYLYTLPIESLFNSV